MASADPLPRRREQAATRAVLDTVGVGLGARRTAEAAVLLRWSATRRPDGTATSWLGGQRTSPAQAALENAFAGHVLDYDDVSATAALHPSVVLVPPLLAMGEARDVDDEQLIDAYDVGAAVFRAVALALPAVEHYRRGWHTSATAGLVAAVAALARLVDLPADRLPHALGMCGSLAAGSLQNFGSWTKPFQVGHAAGTAVNIIELVEAGATANPNQLDAETGFFGMYGDYDVHAIGRLGDALAHWQDAWPADVGIKRYPSCYATHRSLDALRDLLDRSGTKLTAETIDAIRVTVEPRGLLPLRDQPASTGLEGKFDLAYILAALVFDGTVGLSAFDDDAVRRPEPRRLADRVDIVENEHPPAGSDDWGDGYAVVAVRTHDGLELVGRRDHTRGHSNDPMNDDELHDKFRECLHTGGLGAAAPRLLETLTGLANGRVRHLGTAVHDAVLDADGDAAPDRR